MTLLLAACGGGGGNDVSGKVTAPAVDAAFTATVYKGEAPLEVLFDASPSIAGSAPIRSYHWDFGDGSRAEGAQASHDFAELGSHRVTLTVTDGTGAQDRASAVITTFGYGPDPLYDQQWHLKNTGQLGNDGRMALLDQDINVEPVWASDCGGVPCRGDGIEIAIIDDGLQLLHEDLAQNLSSSLRHRVYSSTDTARAGDPSPTDAISAHGTAVAGIVAARDENAVGGRGVAPRASIVGYSMLQAPTTVNEVDAMSHQVEQLAVSSNSWGPRDGYGWLTESSQLWRDAIQHGLSAGRGGRGTVFVWAGGNGRKGSEACPTCQDNSNYDGYANYRGVIAVAAVNAQGQHSSYSEAGANLWISAPGGEYCSSLAITTADLLWEEGINRTGEGEELDDVGYTRCMNGTSAATPVVSGVVALMLQANPNLGWRDVRMILALSARRPLVTDGTGQANAAGIWFSHDYGFGMVDADAAVRMARSWSNLEPEVLYESRPRTVGISLPDQGSGSTAVTDSVTVAGSGISEIEWMEVIFTADHASSGDLEIVLESPNGDRRRSWLAHKHDCHGECGRYDSWRFGSAAFLGEAADGEWRLHVRDLRSGGTGTFESWQLKIYGH